MNPELAAFATSWSWEPAVLAGLGLGAGLYALGWRRLHRQARGRPVLPPWRAWCYAGGLALVALGLLSPVAVFSPLLFSMHMTQHLLLILAAPLLLLGAPLLPVLWALPYGLRRALGLLFVSGRPLHALFHALTHPAVAWTVYVTIVTVWHVPAFYDAAQGPTLIHELEHAMFLGGSLLYWWPVVHPTGGRRRLGYGTAIFYLALPMLEKNIIGMVLTFAGRPLYATYQQVPRVWGMSLLMDQQLAGALMSVVSGVVHLAAIFVVLGLFLRQEERESDRRLGRGRAGADAGGQAFGTRRTRKATKDAPDGAGGRVGKGEPGDNL